MGLTVVPWGTGDCLCFDLCILEDIHRQIVLSNSTCNSN